MSTKVKGLVSKSKGSESRDKKANKKTRKLEESDTMGQLGKRHLKQEEFDVFREDGILAVIPTENTLLSAKKRGRPPKLKPLDERGSVSMVQPSWKLRALKVVHQSPAMLTKDMKTVLLQVGREVYTCRHCFLVFLNDDACKTHLTRCNKRPVKKCSD